MGHPVLLIGLDAADAPLVRRWAADGSLPTFRRLLGEARSTQVENAPGLYTGAVWPSFATGTPVGEHGRYYYRQFRSASYRATRFRTEELPVEPFWMALSRQGKRIAIVDVPKAPLASALNGIQLSDWGCHDAEAAPRSCPASFAAEVEARFGPEPAGPCDLVGPDPKSLARLRAALLERTRLRCALASDLWAREPWDLFVVAFSEAHCGGHRFWHVNDPSHPRFDAAVAEHLGNPLLDVYRELDRAVDRLEKLAGPDAHAVVYLSHGMGAHYDGTFLLDDVLRRLEGGAGAGRAMSLATVARRAWHRAPAALRARCQEWADHAFESARARDRERRRAFVVPTNDNCAGIRLNLVGRERCGLVQPEDRPSILADIRQALCELVEPNTGRPVVREVLDGPATFPGNRSDELPDLLVQWHRDQPILAVHSPRVGRVDGRLGDVRTGDHRAHGLLLTRPGSAGAEDAPSLLPVSEIAGYVSRLMGVVGS